MEIRTHMVWDGRNWSKVDTIRIPECVATPEGIVFVRWAGEVLQWSLPDYAIGQLRAEGDCFDMHCTFTVNHDDGVLAPVAVVLGEDLVLPE